MARLRTALFLAAWVAAFEACAQEVQVEVARQRPPHYVDRPAVIQFTIDGFDQEPSPTIEAEPLPEGLRAK
ncbi:MAG: hypothetical protein ACYC6Y_17380, partial [Thermoguttaceae bacterium]